MIFEFKPEHERLLDRAAQAGMNAEDLVDQAFEVIREQFHSEEWMLADRDALHAKIAEGFAQAERGELIDPGEAIRILRDRRAKRKIA